MDKAPGWARRVMIGRNPRVTLLRIVVLVVVCVVVFRFVLLPVRVQGVSMFPTYRDGSVNFINRLAYLHHEPKRGDVVGLRLGGANDPFRTPGIMFMKRIVGLPGETISFSHGRLLINGIALSEPYLHGPCNWNAAPVTDSSTQYYLVGDNRTMPQEWHEHGRAERQQIVGEVLF